MLRPPMDSPTVGRADLTTPLISGADFGETWSGGPDGSTDKGEEFGKAWSAEPDVDPVKAEKFGEKWSGDNQATPES